MPARALVAVALLAFLGAGTAAAAPATRALYTLRDPRLTEVSGIGVGIASPDVDYVENDSGDSARFFALDGRTGDVLAEYHVPGATNVDWEDLAVARDADGTPSVWLADIGDNQAVRSEIDVYRVDEPHVEPGRPLGVLNSAAPQTWRLRYPDGPHNAESLAVVPGGTAYVITKETKGVVGVYRLPAVPDGGVQTLTAVTTWRVPTALPLAPALLVTGAAISSDGRRLVIRTYLAAYVWPFDGDVAATLARPPTVVPLPVQPVGEAVDFTPDALALIIASENVNSTVYEVAIPGLPVSSSSPVPSSTVPSSTSATALGGDGSGAEPWVVAAVVFIGGALLVGALVRRKRSRAGKIER